jgi:hypothetical protein
VPAMCVSELYRYDNMAPEMGLNSPRFTDIHSGEIKGLKLKFGKYMKDLGKQRRLVDGLPVAESEGVEAGVDSLPVVNVTAKGFPVLPDVEFSTQTQEHLADMMRQYLGMHYSAFII